MALAEDERLKITYGPTVSEPLISIDEDDALDEEAYRLVIRPSGVRLTASCVAGLNYGLSTLAQILRQSQRRIRCLTIRDAPVFAERGVMLDVSRCKVPSMEILFVLIDQLATLKFNQLQLYVEHTFAFDGHETVWKDASPITATELLKIQAYCQARFMKLVPNLNSFGHFERWLRHSDYKHLAESPDGFEHPLTGQRIPWGSTLTPTRASLNLLAELYDQFLPMHDANSFNIGGDEPWELGTGRSRQRCRRLGHMKVYTRFLQQIDQLVKLHGKQAMIWADVVITNPEVLPELPQDATAMLWGYEANHPFPRECRAVAASGMPFYVCPGTGSWNAILGRTDNMRRNIRRAAEQGRRFGAKGLLVTDWGDRGHHQYLPFSYPGFIVAAVHAWTGRTPTEQDITTGLADIFEISRKAARLIMSMGGLDAASGVRCRNSTPFNHGLFPGLLGEDVALSIKPTRASNLLRRLSGLAERASVLEDRIVSDELTTAADMAAHGIRRIQRLQNGIGRPSELRRELLSLIDRHKACWLSRNRPGGLMESTEHLRSSLDKIG